MEQTYEAHAFNPNLSNKTVAGKIAWGRWALRFESAAGNVELPLKELQLRAVSKGDDRLMFRHPNEPDWTIYTVDHEILEHRVFSANINLRNQVQAIQARGVLRKAMIVTLGFFAAFALAAFVVSQLTGWAVRSLVNGIPIAWEQNLGDSLFAEIKTGENVIDDAKAVGALKSLAARLARGLPNTNFTFQFHLLDDPHPNAFAIPGGHVMVHTGLFRVATTSEEVAGVLAHEMAHVTQRHGFRKVASAAGPYLLLTILVHDNRGLLGLIGASSEVLIRQNFSRDYEREADDVGWQYLVAANIDPRGLASFLEKLKTQNEANGLGKLEGSAWNSHPPTAERIARLEAKWRKLKRKTGFADFTPGEPPEK